LKINSWTWSWKSTFILPNTFMFVLLHPMSTDLIQDHSSGELVKKGYGQYLSNILLGNSLINTSMKQNTASAKISMKSRPKNPVTTVVRNFWRESISLYVFARLMSCWLLILEIKLLSDLNYCVNPLASSFIPWAIWSISSSIRAFSWARCL